MRHLLTFDSPVMTYLSLLKDWIVLSLLWVLCSLPVITIGVSTTALYYVTLKMVRHEAGSVVRNFFKAFKENFKQGLTLGVILLICGGILLVDSMYFSGMGGTKGIIMTVLFYSVTASFACMVCYVFPFMAQFSNTIPGMLKSAVYLAARNLPSTILILFLNGLPIWVRLLSFEVFMRMLPLWICMAPAAVAHVCSLRFVKIFAPVIQSIQERQKQTTA